MAVEIATASALGGASLAILTAVADAQPSGTLATALIGAAGTALAFLWRLFKHLDNRVQQARTETAAAHAATIASQAEQMEKLRAQLEESMTANQDLQRQLLALLSQPSGVRMIKRPDGSTEFIRDRNE